MRGKDKRRSPRLELKLEGSLAQADDERGIEKEILTRDISTDGVYLVTDVALQVDERIELHLRLPSLNRSKTPSPVVFFGTVVRMQSFPDGKFGIAVRFDNWLLDTVLQSELRSAQ